MRFLNTLRPRQNGRRFPDDPFKRIFLNENVRILIKIALKIVPKGPINNIPPLVQIMAWRRSGDKPLSEPVMVSLLTHISVTRPQWVKGCRLVLFAYFVSHCTDNCDDIIANNQLRGIHIYMKLFLSKSKLHFIYYCLRNSCWCISSGRIVRDVMFAFSNVYDPGYKCMGGTIY